MKWTPLQEITEVLRHSPTNSQDLGRIVGLVGRVGSTGLTLLFGLDSQINLGVLESLNLYDDTTAPKEVMDFVAASGAAGMSVFYASFSYAVNTPIAEHFFRRVDETFKHYFRGHSKVRK